MNNNYISSVALKMGGPGITDWSNDIHYHGELIDLSVGQPDYPVPVEAITGAYEAACKGYNGYQDSQGIDELRQRLLNKYNISSEEDFDVAITSGATAGLYLALMTCFEPGDEILITDPYFIQYLELIKIHNLVPVIIDIYPDFVINLDMIKKHISNKTKGIILNYPNNPTGCVITNSALEEIIDYLNEKNIYVIYDHIYSDYQYNVGQLEEQYHVAHYSNNVIYINGFSKSMRVTGWRVGYVIAPKRIIYYLTELQAQLYQGVTSTAQYGVLNAMDIDLSDMIKDYSERLMYLKENIDSHYKLSNANGSFFCFIKVPSCLKLSSLEFCKILKTNGLLVVPGNVFSKRDTHFRLSICKPIDDIKKAVNILNKVFYEIQINTIKEYIEKIISKPVSLVGSYGMGINTPNSDIDFATFIMPDESITKLDEILQTNNFEFRGKRPSASNTMRYLYSFWWFDQFVDLVILLREDFDYLVNGIHCANVSMSQTEKRYIIEKKIELENSNIVDFENFKLSIYKRFIPQLLWLNDIDICRSLIRKCKEQNMSFPSWLEEK